MRRHDAEELLPEAEELLRRMRIRFQSTPTTSDALAIMEMDRCVEWLRDQSRRGP